MFTMWKWGFTQQLIKRKFPQLSILEVKNVLVETALVEIAKFMLAENRIQV